MNYSIVSFFNKISSCRTYKFLSVVAFIEFVSAAVLIAFVYSIENSSLRPLGTLMVAFVIACVYSVANLMFAAIIIGEYKFRKNLKEIQRIKLTHIGFVIYIVLTIISIFWFLLNSVFMVI